MASSDAAEGEHEIAWTADQESALFHSMQGHRPVGIAKHFHVACIAHSFSNTMGFTVSPRQIWEHLRSMYDLETLDEREDLPFPNDAVPFALPSDFVDDAGDEDEDERDEKPLRECLSSVEKRTGSAGRYAAPEPSAASASVTPSPLPAPAKRKRTRVSAAMAGSSPSSPSTPAAKRRRT